MAAESTRFTTVPRHATAAAPTRTRTPRDYERALILAAWAAQALAVFFHGGLAGFTSPETAPLLFLGLVGAALVAWRQKAWTFALAGVLLALLPLLVLLVFGAAAELAKPTIGNGYTSLMFLVMTLVLALPAAVAGARRARRHAAPAEPGWRFGLALLASTFLFGAMVAGALASQGLGAGAAGGYDFAPEATAQVVAKDFAFPTAAVRVAQGMVTEVVVENQDPAFHTFTYTAGGATYSHDVPGGASAKFLVKLDAPGEVQYWCEPHSGGAPGAKQGMVGTLVVA